MKLGRKCGIQTWTAFKHITWSLYNCRCKMLHIMAGMREWNDFIYNEISASYQPFPFFKNNTTIINNRGKWWLRQVCQGYLINHKKIWYVLILSQSLDFNFSYLLPDIWTNNTWKNKGIHFLFVPLPRWWPQFSFSMKELIRIYKQNL